jgi:hypothetical protein
MVPRKHKAFIAPGSNIIDTMDALEREDRRRFATLSFSLDFIASSCSVWMLA